MYKSGYQIIKNGKISVEEAAPLCDADITSSMGGNDL